MHWTNGEHAADVRRSVEAERERCAQIAEAVAGQVADGDGELYIAKKIAAAIRSRQERKR